MRWYVQKERQQRDGHGGGRDIEQEDVLQRPDGHEQTRQHGRAEECRRLDGALDAVDACELIRRHELRQQRTDRRLLNGLSHGPHGRGDHDEPEDVLPRMGGQCEQQRDHRNATIGKDGEPFAIHAIGPHAGKWRDDERRYEAAQNVDGHQPARLRGQCHMPHEGILHEGRAEERKRLATEKECGLLFPRHLSDITYRRVHSTILPQPPSPVWNCGGTWPGR